MFNTQTYIKPALMHKNRLFMSYNGTCYDKTLMSKIDCIDLLIKTNNFA